MWCDVTASATMSAWSIRHRADVRYWALSIGHWALDIGHWTSSMSNGHIDGKLTYPRNNSTDTNSIGCERIRDGVGVGVTAASASGQSVHRTGSNFDPKRNCNFQTDHPRSHSPPPHDITYWKRWKNCILHTVANCRTTYPTAASVGGVNSIFC